MNLIALYLTCILAAVNLQQPSFFDAFKNKSVDECMSVEYKFNYITSGVRTFGEGVLDIQGNSYHMRGNGIEIFCDGSTTWMLDEDAKEVVIEAADSQSAGYLANPVMLLMNIENTALSYEIKGDVVTLELPGGVSLEITICSLQKVQTKKSEAFRPPTDFDSTWIVTDLR